RPQHHGIGRELEMIVVLVRGLALARREHHELVLEKHRAATTAARPQTRRHPTTCSKAGSAVLDRARNKAGLAHGARLRRAGYRHGVAWRVASSTMNEPVTGKCRPVSED